MNNESPNDAAQSDFDEDYEQSAYSNLVYVFCFDADEGQKLATSLARYNHEVISFDDMEEFRSAVLIRAPRAVVLDIDSENGKLIKQVFAHRVITTFPVIYISKDDSDFANTTLAY